MDADEQRPRGATTGSARTATSATATSDTPVTVTAPVTSAPTASGASAAGGTATTSRPRIQLVAGQERAITDAAHGTGARHPTHCFRHRALPVTTTGTGRAAAPGTPAGQHPTCRDGSNRDLVGTQGYGAASGRGGVGRHRPRARV